MDKTRLLALVSCLILCTFSGTTTSHLQVNTPKTSAIFQKQIFVDQQNYFYYDIYTHEGKVLVNILNRNLKRQTLTFKSKYDLYYRDAYYNFIVLQQMNGKTSISYWVLEIVECGKGHTLSSWRVNSQIDNEGFNLTDSYLLLSIVEYNSKDQLLYVRLQTYPNATLQSSNSTGDTDLYAIDVAKKGKTLITISWFYFNQKNREKIIGGNSRVFVQATNTQIWIDTQNIRKNDSDPTVFEKINITSLTTLPIYQKGSLSFKLRDSFFVYASLSQDSLHMTAFAWKGYTKNGLVGARHLHSNSKPIRFFYDEWSFFLAVADNDLYISQIYWNNKTKEYDVWVTTLLQTVKDECDRKEYLEAFDNALDVLQHDDRLFVLTENKFYVFINVKLFEMTLSKKVQQKDTVQESMFKSMNKYYLTLK